ncbi:MAG: hypothetical protein OWU84_10395 [Firmicutes bacterium]|nr:hypothetical protein [Bacillota bacterium]
MSRILTTRDGPPLCWPRWLSQEGCTAPAEDLLSRPLGWPAETRLGDVATLREGSGPADRLVVDGDTRRWVGLGDGWAEGELVVFGGVGAEAGRLMRGGVLTVEGDAEAGLGAGMRGGILVVKGRAGEGAGRPAGLDPMQGGLIVAESMGDRAGFGMHRGIIAARRLGREAGLAMRAGTLVAEEMASVGRGVRRGSLIARRVQEWPEFFVPSGIVASSYRALLGQLLSPYGFSWLLRPAYPRRWVGDQEELGKGELWLCP